MGWLQALLRSQPAVLSLPLQLPQPLQPQPTPPLLCLLQLLPRNHPQQLAPVLLPLPGPAKTLHPDCAQLGRCQGLQALLPAPLLLPLLLKQLLLLLKLLLLELLLLLLLLPSRHPLARPVLLALALLQLLVAAHPASSCCLLMSASPGRAVPVDPETSPPAPPPLPRCQSQWEGRNTHEPAYAAVLGAAQRPQPRPLLLRAAAAAASPDPTTAAPTPPAAAAAAGPAS